MKNFFNKIIKISSLILFCTFVSFVIVFPLWIFAVKLNNLYTFTSLIIIFSTLIYTYIKYCKKNSIRKNIQILLNTLVIIIGLCTSILLAIQEKRILSIATIFIIPIICILFSVLLKKRKQYEK